MSAQFAVNDHFTNKKVEEIKSLLQVPGEPRGVVLTNKWGEEFAKMEHERIIVAETHICGSGNNWLFRVTLETKDGRRAVFREWSDKPHFTRLETLGRGDLVRFLAPLPNDPIRIERYRLEETEPPPPPAPQARTSNLFA